jgi:hypothetical protein
LRGVQLCPPPANTPPPPPTQQKKPRPGGFGRPPPHPPAEKGVYRVALLGLHESSPRLGSLTPGYQLPLLCSSEDQRTLPPLSRMLSKGGAPTNAGSCRAVASLRGLTATADEVPPSRLAVLRVADSVRRRTKTFIVPVRCAVAAGGIPDPVVDDGR